MHSTIIEEQQQNNKINNKLSKKNSILEQTFRSRKVNEMCYEKFTI